LSSFHALGNSAISQIYLLDFDTRILLGPAWLGINITVGILPFTTHVTLTSRFKLL